MMHMCCTQSNGLGRVTLGQLEEFSAELQAFKASIPIFKSFIDEARSIWDDLIAAFGIGAGRREADVIVPEQNRLVTTVIAPVSAFLTSYKENPSAYSCNELYEWKSTLKIAEDYWLHFLHDTPWMDGRAARQAEDTLAPYFLNARTDLQKYINECGGSIFASGNLPVIVGVGVLALLLLRKGK